MRGGGHCALPRETVCPTRFCQGYSRRLVNFFGADWCGALPTRGPCAFDAIQRLVLYHVTRRRSAGAGAAEC
eukprot:2146207-Pleurochrysis_carterae.AAC.1